MDCSVVNSFLRASNALFGVKIEDIFGMLTLNTGVSVVEWPFNGAIFNAGIFRDWLLCNVFGSIKICLFVLLFQSVSPRIRIKNKPLLGLGTIPLIDVELIRTNHTWNAIIKGSQEITISIVLSCLVDFKNLLSFVVNPLDITVISYPVRVLKNRQFFNTYCNAFVQIYVELFSFLTLITRGLTYTPETRKIARYAAASIKEGSFLGAWTLADIILREIK